ncbi:MAG TPA: tyrosine-type recombinase/integrase [Hyphomonas sp.]|nr:integrase [Hyphomonas sp.]HRI99802.1 tyrosine-type recombinase/integrase [Hyphomonas sp.]
MKLTDFKIKALKPGPKPLRAADGRGMYIEVKPNGTKLFKMAYRYDGKQKTLSFGDYPITTLAKARERMVEAHRLLRDGIDPMAQFQSEKQAKLSKTEHTFSKIAAELLEKRRKEGLSDATLTKKRWLVSLAAADIGDMPIREIKAPDILVPLRKIESDGNYETAKRTRALIGEVFRYAIATARAEFDPTVGLRGALISPRVTHRAAIVEREPFAELCRAVWAFNGQPEVQTALKLMVLLYPRPGELRLSKWDEFDLANRKWTIPAARMKMRREHIKPLPGLAVELLEDLRSQSWKTDWVFPSRLSRARSISENTLNGSLRRMGFGAEEMTSHGFRASASSLLNESGKWQSDAIEAELAHFSGDQVRRTYHRAAYWKERVEMAEWWAGEVLGYLMH